MHERETPAVVAAGRRMEDAGRGQVSTTARTWQEFDGMGRTLAPEALAVLGLARWPWAILAGRNFIFTVCPRCWIGGIALLPPTRPGERLMLATLGPCLGDGLGCPPDAIREAARAVLRGRPVPVNAGDARRLAPLLVRVLPDLWSGRRGHDPRRALWACRLTLEEVGLAPHLVALGVQALARRRGWPDALAEAVLGREAAA